MFKQIVQSFFIMSSLGRGHRCPSIPQRPLTSARIYTLLILFKFNKSQFVFADIGVISTYQIQLLDNNIVQKTMPVMWQNVVANTYDSIDDDIYFSEEMFEPRNGTISRFKLSDDQATAEIIVDGNPNALTIDLTVYYYIFFNT